MKFYLPPHPKRDFDEWLATELANTNTSFVHIPDFYNQPDPPVTYRGSRTRINWKSNVNNADMTKNFWVGLDTPINKGDIVLFPAEGSTAYYLVNWEVDPLFNAKAAQVSRCNAMLAFKRETPETVDADGMLVTEAGAQEIAGATPCMVVPVYMRHEYAKREDVPGIVTSDMMEVSTQFNSTTDSIVIDDFFAYRKFTYKVIDIVYALDIDEEFGIIKFTAKKVLGGDR